MRTNKMLDLSIFTRISLPQGIKDEFETVTGLKLKEPPRVQLN